MLPAPMIAGQMKTEIKNGRKIFKFLRFFQEI